MVRPGKVSVEPETYADSKTQVAEVVHLIGVVSLSQRVEEHEKQGFQGLDQG